MKKFILSIMIMIYIAISSGFAISLHYCKGELFEWKFGEQKEMCSGCSTKTCCSDETHLIKLETDQKEIQKSSTDSIIPFVILFIPFFLYGLFQLCFNKSNKFIKHYSLNYRFNGVPIFICICLLLI